MSSRRPGDPPQPQGLRKMVVHDARSHQQRFLTEVQNGPRVLPVAVATPHKGAASVVSQITSSVAAPEAKQTPPPKPLQPKPPSFAEAFAAVAAGQSPWAWSPNSPAQQQQPPPRDPQRPPVAIMTQPRNNNLRQSSSDDDTEDGTTDSLIAMIQSHTRVVPRSPDDDDDEMDRTEVDDDRESLWVRSEEEEQPTHMSEEVALLETSLISSTDLNSFETDGSSTLELLSPTTTYTEFTQATEPSPTDMDTPSKLRGGSPYSFELSASSSHLSEDYGSSSHDNDDDPPKENPTPFNTFRQNSASIALEESKRYLDRIGQLERELTERQNRKSALLTPKTPLVSNLSKGSPDSENSQLWERNKTLVKEVRFADQTCVELSAEKQTLQKQVAALDQQLQQTLTQCETLEKDLKKSTALVVSAESQKHVLQQRVSELEAKAPPRVLEQRIAELEESLQQAQEAEQEAKHELEQRTQELEAGLHGSQHLQELELVKEEVESLRTIVEELDADRQKIEDDRDSLQRRLDEMEDETADKLQFEEERDSLQERIEELERRLHDESVSREALVVGESAVSEVDRLQRHCESLQERIAELEDEDREGGQTREVELARKQLKWVREENEFLKSEVDHSAARCEKAEQHFEDLQRRILELECERDELATKNEHLELRQETASPVSSSTESRSHRESRDDDGDSETRDRVAEMEHTASSLRSELEMSKRRLKLTTEEKDILKDRLKSADADKSKLHDEIVSTKEKVSLLESDSRDLSRRLELANAQLNEMREENEVLTKDLTEFYRSGSTAKANCTSLQLRLSELQATNRAQAKTLEAREQEIEGLREEKESLQAELDESRRSFLSIEKELFDKKEQVEHSSTSLAERLTETETELSQANDRIRSLSLELGQTRSRVASFAETIAALGQRQIERIEGQARNRADGFTERLDGLSGIVNHLRESLEFNIEADEDETYPVDYDCRPVDTSLDLVPVADFGGALNRTADYSLMEAALPMLVDLDISYDADINTDRTRLRSQLKDDARMDSRAYTEGDTFSSLEGLTHLFSECTTPCKGSLSKVYETPSGNAPQEASELDRLLHNNEKLQRDLRTAVEGLQTYEDRVRELDAEFANLSHRNRDLGSEQETLRKELAKAEAKRELVEAELDKKAAELTNLESVASRVPLLSKDLESARAELSAAHQEASSLEKELCDTRSELVELRASFVEVTDEERRLRTQLSETLACQSGFGSVAEDIDQIPSTLESGSDDFYSVGPVESSVSADTPVPPVAGMHPVDENQAAVTRQLFHTIRSNLRAAADEFASLNREILVFRAQHGKSPSFSDMSSPVLKTIDKMLGDLSHHNERLLESHSHLRQSVGQYEADLAEKQKKIDDTLRKLSASQRAEARLVETENECQNLKSALDSLLREKKDIEDEATRNAEEKARLHESNSSLRISMDSLRSECEERGRRLEVLEEFKSLTEKLKGELEAKRKELAEASAQTQNLRRFADAQVDLVREREEQIEDLRNKLDREKLESEQIERDCVGSKAQLQSVEGELASTRTKYDRLYEEHLKLENETNELRRSVADYSRHLAEANEERSRLSKSAERLEFLEGECASLETRLRDATDEHRRATGELDSKSRLLAGYLEETSDLKESVSRLQDLVRDRDELEVRVRSLESEKDEKMKEIEGTMHELLHLRETLSSLSEDHDGMKRRHDKLESEYALATMELSECKDELSNLRREFGELNSSYKQCTDERDSLRSASASADEDIMSLTRELKAKALQVERIEGECKILRKSSEQLRLAVSQYESDKHSLTLSLSRSESELEDLKRAYIEANEKLANQVEMSTVNDDMLKTYELAQQAADDLVTDSEFRLMETKTELERMRTERDSLHDQNEELSVSLRFLQNRLTMFQRESEERTKSTKDETEKLSSSHGEQASQIDQLKNELLRTKQEWTGRLGEVRAQLQRACADRDEKHSKVMELEDRVKQLRVRCAKPSDEAVAIRKELDAMKMDLRRKDNEIGFHRSRTESLESKCDRLREYVRKLTTKCDEWESFYHEQAQVIEDLKKANEKTKSKSMELARRYQKRDKMFSDERAEWSSERENLQKAHSQLEEEIAGISRELSHVASMRNNRTL